MRRFCKSVPTALTVLACLVLFGARAAAAEEEYNVTVVFLGLMTFELPPDEPTVARVLIPAVREPVKLGNDEHEIHPHIPYILATRTAMGANLPLNKCHVFNEPDEGADVYHYLLLDGETISIDDENAVSSLNPQLKYNNSGCDRCPDANTATALCWLSSLKAVRGGAVQERSAEHFTKVPSPKHIAARMIVRHAQSFEAHVLHETTQKTAALWTFATPKKGGHHDDTTKPQALAQEVHWNFKARGTPFVLNLVGYNGGARRVAFMPEDGSLLIVIGNTVEEDTGPVAVPVKALKDEHYSVYHRFVKNNPEGYGRIPFRIEDDKCTDATFLHEPTLRVTARAGTLTSRGLGHHKRSPKLSVAADGPNPAPGGLNCTPDQWP